MPNDIAKLRRLMKAANALRHTRPAILRGAQLDARNALKYAWWFEFFRAKLRTGSYRFSYFKKDGSIREAVGTLCLDIIPERDHPKGDSAQEPSPNVFVYYDLYADGDAGGWRSFCLENFIGFVEKVNA